MSKIKLCGMMEEKDILTANRLKPDYVGFIFFKKSHRDLTPEKAKALKALLDKDIKAVGVFVDDDPEFIKELARNKVFDIIQLHGSESPEMITSLKEETGLPVFKAFKLNKETDLSTLINSPADMILVDSGYGTGKRFDWDLLKGLDRDYILAGGLDCENVKEALIKLAPWGVDVSSGIETDKKKDIDKMERFVRTVREEEENGK